MRLVTSPILAALEMWNTSPRRTRSTSRRSPCGCRSRDGDPHADEVDRRAAGTRVAQQRRVVDVGVVIGAVGDDDEGLAPLQRPELVEAEHDRVVERRRAAGRRLARRTLERSGIAGQLLDHARLLAEFDDEALVLVPDEAAEELRGGVVDEGHRLLHRARAVHDQPDRDRELLSHFEPRDRLRAAVLLDLEVRTRPVP